MLVLPQSWIIVIPFYQAVIISLLRLIQVIQNSAVCVLTITHIREHIYPILASLHWLPVKSGIEIKILFLTCNSIS